MALSIPARLKRRFTRADLYRMEAAGVILPDERIELIDGELLQKELPMNSPHATAVSLCNEALRQMFGAGYVVRVQIPLTLSERDEPLPDLAVVEGAIRDFEQRHPTTAVLIVEISETTLAFDRRVKGSLYAWAGVPDYWIVNLAERVVEVYRQPTPTARTRYGYAYQTRQLYRPDDALAPLAVPDVAIPVSELLPSVRQVNL